jgi:hypothetical protein
LEKPRFRFVYEMVLQEEFARWGGEPTLPLAAIDDALCIALGL